jgi:hypothetical protein
MYEHKVGSREAYDFHLKEAAAAKWMRNGWYLGTIAVTALVAKSELPPENYAEAGWAGVAVAGIGYWLMDRERRSAIHDSKIDASFAVINAKLDNQPVPQWAQDNTGNILDKSFVYGNTSEPAQE